MVSSCVTRVHAHTLAVMTCNNIRCLATSQIGQNSITTPVFNRLISSDSCLFLEHCICVGIPALQINRVHVELHIEWMGRVREPN